MMAWLQEKIDQEAALGLCRKVDAGMLMLDIVSLNVFSYMAAAAVNAALAIAWRIPRRFWHGVSRKIMIPSCVN